MALRLKHKLGQRRGGSLRLKARGQVNFASLRVETNQFVFCGERHNLANDLLRLFDLDCHD